MLVFLCHPYHRGGVTSWMKDAFLYCQSAGIESKFLSVRPKKEFISGGNRPDMLSFLGVKKDVHFLEEDFKFELGTFDNRVNTYLKIIKNFVPKGSVLIPSDDEACFVASLASDKSIKVLGVLHSDDTYYYALYNKYKDYLSGVVSVSERIKSKAKPAKKSLPHHVIPCGIKLDEFHASKSKENIIVWVGRVEEEQKRVSDIIPIAEKLNQIYEDWEIRVFGDGAELGELKTQAEKKGLGDKLRFFGWTSSNEIKENLSKSKVLLQTSNYEGMSVAVMEALGSGCSIVSSQVSGVEDLLGERSAESSVFLFEIGDTDMASKLLKEALIKYSSEVSLKSLDLATNFYSIKSNVENLIKFGKDISSIRKPLRLNYFSFINRILSHSISLVRLAKFKLSK